MSASKVMQMALLDRAFFLLDSSHSPQDFTLIFHLNHTPDIERFYAGARSAMNRFPTSASCVARGSWVWRENKYFKLEFVSDVSESESRAAIERRVNDRFDLRRQSPVKQVLIVNGSDKSCLATRFHHSAADGLSAAMWLGHQLNVAYGIEESRSDREPFVDLELRRLSPSVRRSQFAFAGASDPLWSSSSKSSGCRRWLTISFSASELQKGCRRAGGFTYNDLLATCALETLAQWNKNAGARSYKNSKIGLWVPINVRRKSNAGFGNGTSRIRIYNRYKADAPLLVKCREVRSQVSWTSKHGEWVIPEIPWFNRLPGPVIGPLLRGYLRLPSVDMATAVFSHAGSWIANTGEAFKHVEKIECVGLLHPRQRVALNAATHRRRTCLTFTYDPALLNVEEVHELGRIYEQQIGLAHRELA